MDQGVSRADQTLLLRGVATTQVVALVHLHSILCDVFQASILLAIQIQQASVMYLSTCYGLHAQSCRGI